MIFKFKEGHIYTLLVLALTMTFQSCSSLVPHFYSWVYGQGFARSTRLTLTKSLEMVDSSGKKSIFILPMCHVGSIEDYEKIALFIDGLKGNGYVTFVEGIKPPAANLDSSSVDTLLRKMRKLLGFNPATQLDYLVSKHNGWTYQSESILHLCTEKDLYTDISIDEFIWQFELKHGPIVLDEYDYSCPLDENDNYKRKPSPKYKRPIKSIVCDYRNEVLRNHIVNDGYEKIVVIYGGEHTKMMKYSLQRDGFKMKHPRGKRRSSAAR